MNDVRRGLPRLSRFFRVKGSEKGQNLGRPLGLKRFAPGGARLRQLIEDETVVTFVPTILPLIEPDVACTHAMIEFQRRGSCLLTVRMETGTSDAVAFVIGFRSNAGGYWLMIFGSLNDKINSWTTSQNRSGIFTIEVGSNWVQQRFLGEVRQGLTFRLQSTKDLQSSPRALVQQWARKFEAPLGRPLSLLDLDDSSSLGISAVDEAIANVKVIPDGSDTGVSFDLRVIFE